MIAIDGVDGAGKTTFADRIGPLVAGLGRAVVRASVDGFHNPRSVRYCRGRDDPFGFFADSYDYDVLKSHLIGPFKAGADAVEVARFDHRTDRRVTDASRTVDPLAVLILDGIFLHRDELRGLWDFSIFLHAPYAETFARMAKRDGCDPNPYASTNRRYYEGQNLYLSTCNPQARADLVIDNSAARSII